MSLRPRRRWRHRAAAPAFAAVLAIAGRLACAAEPDALSELTNLSLSGFGTFGVVHQNAPAGVGFQRDYLERANDGGTRADIDTRLGVQANYRVSSEFELVAQVVAANRIANAPASDILSLGFAAWRPSEELTLRVGRMSTDYFLFSDYRHIGFAYPFVRPPVENYGSLPYGIDGVDLTQAWHLDETVWKLRGLGGTSRRAGEQPGSALTLRPVFAMVLSRDDGNGLLVKASAVRTRVHGDAAAVQPLIDALRPIGALPVPDVAAQAQDLAARLALDGQPVTYYSLGASYDRGPWLASLEVSRAQPKTTPYTSVWGMVGHRWGAVTGYGAMSAIHTEMGRSPPQWTATLTPVVGAALAAQLQQVGSIAFSSVAMANASQHTLTVGIRWDFCDRAALKLQWDRVRVAAYGGRLWSTRTPADPINANIGSATLDFVF